MSREFKIGILAIITIAVVIWGYKFIQGKNLFSRSNTFHIIYDNVDQLTVSAPVLINGYEVGNVTNIQLNPDDVNNIIVSIEIKGEIDVPKDAKALLTTKDIMGNKIIEIKYDKYCSGEDCSKSGDYLEGGYMGLMDKLLGAGEQEKVMENMKNELTGVIDTIATSYAGETVKEDVSSMVQSMKSSLENLESITARVNNLINASFKDMDKTMENLASITGNIADNNTRITAILSDLENISNGISESNPGEAVSSATEALKETKLTVESLRETLTLADNSFTKLSDVLEKIDSGEGSLPMLLNDKELYENLNGASEHLRLLLQDVRLNPKRYASFSVFGKKQKDYTKPEDDPGLNNDNN